MTSGPKPAPATTDIVAGPTSHLHSTLPYQSHHHHLKHPLVNAQYRHNGRPQQLYALQTPRGIIEILVWRLICDPALAMDPALVKYASMSLLALSLVLPPSCFGLSSQKTDMYVNRHKYFRWTPRTAWLTLTYMVAVPALFGWMGYATDVSCDTPL